MDAEPVPQKQTIADHVPITAIMSTDTVTARADTPIDELRTLFEKHHVGCVPIVDERNRPHGIVTMRDLVERGSTSAMTAAEVLMPLALTLHEHATIAHAAAMMSNEDLHHLMVVGEDEALIGVVSTLDIVHWLAKNDGFTHG